MLLATMQIPKSLYSPGGHYMHEVAPNDTLAGVALAYNMRVDELKRLNRLYGSSAIFPGQRLRVRANTVSKQNVDSMNTSAQKSSKLASSDKFRKEMSEDPDLKTSAGSKKKKRIIKNRHEDMLAPVDIIQAADHVAGPETETDSKIGTDANPGNKPAGIKGEDITKKLSKKYKLFMKKLTVKKNVATSKILEDGAPSSMNRSTDKKKNKNKIKIKKSKGKVKTESKSNEIANLTAVTQNEVFKTRAQLVYHTNEVYVSGEITIAMGNISFEPDLDNSYVQKFGCAMLTVSFSLDDVIKCDEINDDMRMDYDKEKEKLLCIELKPLEGQLMMQTRSSLEFLIPTDKFAQCLTLLRGSTNNNTQQQNNLNDNLVHSVESLTRSYMSPTALPVLNQESALISLENARKLARFFPNRHRCDDWVQLYTSTRDGFSWRTLYSKIKKAVPTILIFKDSNGYTFGAFVAHQWQKGPNFYGNGETFLFSLVPNFGVYKWTEKNSFFVTSSDSHFAFGGCEYGLYLDDELCSGSSYRSDTYFNRCLASEEEFQCVAVEAWTLKSK